LIGGRNLPNLSLLQSLARKAILYNSRLLILLTAVRYPAAHLYTPIWSDIYMLNITKNET